MLTEKLRIFTRIYKYFDPIFSPILYYSLIFGLLRISIGLSVFGFVANEYKRITICSLSNIRNIWSGIRWAKPKVILNYSTLPKKENIVYARQRYAFPQTQISKTCTRRPTVLSESSLLLSVSWSNWTEKKPFCRDRTVEVFGK